MSKKTTAEDPTDLDEIADWLWKAQESMRLPPCEVTVKQGKIKKAGERYTAEIEVDEDYHQMIVTVDRDRFNKKTITQQKLCLTHELCHAVAFRFDQATERYLHALYDLIPSVLLDTPQMEKLEGAMESEGEKLVDHMAFLALTLVPKWRGK